MELLFAFWKPIAALIALVAIGVAFHFWKDDYDDARRAEGAAPVRAEFNAYKAAQDKQRADIILDYTAKLGKAHDEKVTDDLASARRLAILDDKTGNVVNTLGGVHLPADLVGVFDASSRAANGRAASADGGGRAGAETLPIAPEAAAGVYDERELALYLKAGGAAYDDAYGLWQSCRKREDACRDARAKGTP